MSDIEKARYIVKVANPAIKKLFTSKGTIELTSGIGFIELDEKVFGEFEKELVKFAKISKASDSDQAPKAPVDNSVGKGNMNTLVGGGVQGKPMVNLNALMGAVKAVDPKPLEGTSGQEPKQEPTEGTPNEGTEPPAA